MTTLRQAAAALPMRPMKYVAGVCLPALFASLVFSAALLLLFPGVFSGGFASLAYAIPAFTLVAMFVYPFALADRKRADIHNRIHLFITHMGVLATSSMARVEVFRVLSEKKEYGALAEESHRIHELVKRWNMGLSDACRFVAKRTPSAILADFLERFAYSLDGGEDFELFLRHEQSIVMEHYGAWYRGRLYAVENLKGIFVSLVMTAVFLLVFVLILPSLTGSDPGLLLGCAILVIGLVEVFFLHLAKAQAPTDPLWFSDAKETPLHLKILKTLPVSLLAIPLLVWLALKFDAPPAIAIAIGLTPLLVTGFAVSNEENLLKRRDDNFPAFVRSLGASAGSRAGGVVEVLKNLRHHDFGSLTPNVRSLYHRLNVRVDDRLAWRYFAAEAGSNLIDKFSAMFHEGIRAGGKPEQIGMILAENAVRLLALRKQRFQIAASLRGLFYGLAAGMAFALFAGLGVLKMLMGVLGSVEVPEGAAFLKDFLAAQLAPETTLFLMLVVLLLHCGACALMIRLVEGGNPFASWVDFVGLFWVAAITSSACVWGLERLLGPTWTG